MGAPQGRRSQTVCSRHLPDGVQEVNSGHTASGPRRQSDWMSDQRLSVSYVVALQSIRTFTLLVDASISVSTSLRSSHEF
jgi:hypothetical protein